MNAKSSRDSTLSRILIFTFGIIFLAVILVLATAFPYPTPFAYLVFRVVLALAAGAIASQIPGALNVAFTTRIRGIAVKSAGGLAAFTVVYFFNPAGIAPAVDPKELPILGRRIAESLAIDVPRPDEIISNNVYDGMRGKLQEPLPEGYRLWVLAQDRYNFFLMYPPTEVVAVKGEWSQSNIRLATPGVWNLNVAIADRRGSDALEKKAHDSDWSGLPTLPPGVEIIRSVRVQRN